MEALVLVAVIAAILLWFWGLAELMAAAAMGSGWAKLGVFVMTVASLWLLVSVFAERSKSHDPRPCLKTITVFIYNHTLKTSLPYTSCEVYAQPEGTTK